MLLVGDDWAEDHHDVAPEAGRSGSGSVGGGRLPGLCGHLLRVARYREVHSTSGAEQRHIMIAGCGGLSLHVASRWRVRARQVVSVAACHIPPLWPVI